MSSPAAGWPTVSVVIPARDDATALARCLDLLAAQTLAPLEVVVVDNGSTDQTARVARERGARVVAETVVGIPQAAARGYDEARGEVVARLDADSRPDPRWVERVASRMHEPDLVAVTGVGVFYDAPRGVRGLWSLLYLGAYYAFTHLALGHTTLWGSSMAVRRSVWQEVRGQVHRDDAELHDDLDLAFVLGPHRRIRLDPRLSVGVSARSLHGRAQRRRRMERARRTIETNWAVQPPWLRWRDRWTRPRRVRSHG